MYHEKVMHLDQKYNQLQSACQEVRQEVESGREGGEILVGGLNGIGRLIWKGIQFFFQLSLTVCKKKREKTW